MEEKPKLHVVMFSGGKDSTAMLLKMIEENYPIDIILYCHIRGLEFPEMDEHIKKVETYIGRKITIIESEKDFMYWASEHEFKLKTNNLPGFKPGDVVKGYGWPSMFSRWCTRSLKIDLVNKYFRDLKKDYEVIQYSGIAIDEGYRFERKNNQQEHLKYPLVDFNMTEKDCLEYCYSRGFDWGGLYEIWDRVSCWCCPLQSLDDLRKLKKHRPELWERLRDMDKKIQDSLGNRSKKLNFQFTKSFTDIDRRFEVEDEFLSQGKKLRTKEFFKTLRDRGINY